MATAAVKISKRKTWFALAKVAIACLLLANIYQHVFVSENFNDVWQRFSEGFNSSSVFLLIVVGVLMLVNWGLEAAKWQFVISKAEKVTFANAFMAVLCGSAIGLLTPNRVGEYAGRLLVIRQTNFLRIINLTLIGSFAQMVAIIVCGVAGFEFLIYRFSNLENYLQWLTIFLSVGFVGLVIFLFFNLRLFYSLFTHIKWLGKWRRYFRVWNYFSAPDLIRVLLLAFARYMVYAFQFFVLIKVFVGDIPTLNVFFIITVIYFLQFIIPSIALAELGIRESLAMYFFGFIHLAAPMVISASFLLWIINLIIPALIGTFFILKINISKTKTYGSQ